MRRLPWVTAPLKRESMSPSRERAFPSAASEENGSVEITVVRKEQEAVVTVKDTGIGIPAEHQSRIFERFFRVDKSRSKASGGTGLGLSIVKHIAQYHGATIKLQSEFGCGTTVSVVFPL